MKKIFTFTLLFLMYYNCNAQSTKDINWLTNKTFEFSGKSTVILAFNSTSNNGIYTFKTSFGNTDCPFIVITDKTKKNTVKVIIKCEDEDTQTFILEINQQNGDLVSGSSVGGKKMIFTQIK